jgi:TolB-like protein/Flp pilus assembly protein TadD
MFLAELKRRKVYRVAAVYAAVGVAISLAVPDLFGAFDLPNSAARLVILLIAIGFPIALVLAWAYEVRPEEPGPGLVDGSEVASPVESAVAGQASPEVSGKEEISEGSVAESAVFALPKGPAIAVLPFTNMSGNPDDEFFTDGMTEDIITGLARFTRLFVIARNSTFRFKGRGVDVREVGRELGARYVLEGAIRRSAGHLRVNSQLIDASTGTHLWAETYDRDLTTGEIFAVQDDITNRVVATLAGAEGVLTRSGASKLKTKPPGSLDAYEAVLRNFSYWDRQSPGEHLEVREALERAVEIDPQYGHAWACLAILYLDEFRVGFNPRPDPLERALAAARRSVELDPAGHLSQHALAQVHFYRGDLDAFFPAAQKGVELNPNDSTIVAMTGLLTAYAGEWESGLAMLEKAMALNPYHPGWYYFPLAFNHYRNGDYERALDEAKKVNMPGYHPSHMALAAIHGQLGRTEEARVAVENLLELFPDYGARAREELRKWFRTSDLLEHLVDGLCKAGLRISGC